MKKQLEKIQAAIAAMIAFCDASKGSAHEAEAEAEAETALACLAPPGSPLIAPGRARPGRTPGRRRDRQPMVDLTGAETLAVLGILDREGLGSKTVHTLTGLDRPVVRRILQQLVECGKIRQKGHKRGAIYCLPSEGSQ